MDKEKLIELTKNEMKVWQTRLDELKVQASLGKSELREILQPEIKRIEEELRKVEERVNQFQSSSGSAFEDMKHGADAAFKALQESFKKASSHFRK